MPSRDFGMEWKLSQTATRFSSTVPVRQLGPTNMNCKIEGLNDFMNWADQWQLRVAEHKCLVLSHGNCDAPGYYLKDVNLDNVNYLKDFGVIVDNHCLFKQHV